MTVREAAVGDVARIAEIHVASWRAAYAGILPADRLASLDVDEIRRWREWRLADRLAPRSVTLVVEEGGRPVGFADLGPARDDDAPKAGEVYAIYLDPAAWGRGLGAALLRSSEQALTSLGFESAVLWVVEANARARAFYEAMGWLPDGRRAFAAVYDLQVMEVRYACDFVKECT